ncbi:MAG: hypothetical protein M3297_11915, partial [Thermoproteota archaeon]|nr:hypothetical protein [Thermoproteota archaeon]
TGRRRYECRLSMPEHGEYNPDLKQWYCRYWMSKELWFDIHDYAPPNVGEGPGSSRDSGDQGSSSENHSEISDKSQVESNTQIESQQSSEESTNNGISGNYH